MRFCLKLQRKNRTFYLKLLIICITCTFYLLLFLLQFHSSNIFSKSPKYRKGPEADSQSYKTLIDITFWISPQSPPSESRQFQMKKAISKLNSDFKNFCGGIDINHNFDCQFSMRSENIKDFDAVVFFMFLDGYAISDLPNLSERNLKQLWVMFALEPPVASRWKDPLMNIFNWTMTNRRDSDVWAPYGFLIPEYSSKKNLPAISNFTLKDWVSQKSKLVVGVISNCYTRSKRETLISRMNKTGIARIDILGGCGDARVCGRYEHDCTNFWDKIAREYKFFLAFENSLCEDYITEKFWRALTLGMVPVVYGAGKYKTEAPPNSYIDIKDFPSEIALMTYLVKLDNDHEEYMKYFQWRKGYTIRGEDYAWCHLCKAVFDFKRKTRIPMEKTYENLQWWYLHKPASNESVCHNPRSKFVS